MIWFELCFVIMLVCKIDRFESYLGYCKINRIFRDNVCYKKKCISLSYWFKNILFKLRNLCLKGK